MTELVIIGGLIAFTAWREWICARERKDLLTRLMARDLSEYTAITSSRPPPKSVNFIARGIKKHYDALREDQ